MPLSHTAVTNAKPKVKVYKLFDGGGLYMMVKPTGYKSWKYDYRLSNSRGTYTIGQYPDISLKQARERHKDARKYVPFLGTLFFYILGMNLLGIIPGGFSPSTSLEPSSNCSCVIVTEPSSLTV